MWRLYSSTGELKYNDELVHRLSYSETIVLSLLISHHGQLVMKDTLLDLGWPNKIVAPNSLATAIKGIRKAIKTADSDVYIETIYRRGYILHHNNNIEIVMADATPLPEHSESIPTADDHISLLSTPLEHSALTLTNENELFPISEKINGDTLSSFWGGVIKSVKHKHIFFYSALLFFGVLSFVVFIAREDVYCTKLDNAMACGVFKLSEYKRQQIVALIGDQTGTFLYGYNNKLDNIELHQVDELDSSFDIWSASIH